MPFIQTDPTLTLVSGDKNEAMRFLRRNGLFLVALAGCAAGSAFAGTSFNLGLAGNYGVIMGSGSASNDLSTNNFTINATVGIESGGYFSASGGPETVTGVQFGSAVNDTYSGGATYTPGTAIVPSNNLTGANNAISNTSITNGLLQNAAPLVSAATSIANLSTLANGTISGGTSVNLNVGAGSATLNAVGSQTVFDATSVNIGNGGTITIHGDGSGNQLVIINVSGNFVANNNTSGGGVILTGGIAADQVLWNIYSAGTGNNFQSSGGAAFNIIQGIFLDVAGSYNLNQITVDGWLFGANSDGGSRTGLTDQLVSVGTVNQGAYTPAAAPEPSTWAMMLGACGLFYVGDRRRRNCSRPA